MMPKPKLEDMPLTPDHYVRVLVYENAEYLPNEDGVYDVEIPNGVGYETYPRYRLDNPLPTKRGLTSES